jgi:hypothetical protein
MINSPEIGKKSVSIMSFSDGVVDDLTKKHIEIMYSSSMKLFGDIIRVNYSKSISR